MRQKHSSIDIDDKTLMEKIINQTAFDTANMEKIAGWESNGTQETLYFSHCGQYLLHCISSNAIMENQYGTKTISNEDLIILENEDALGWMQVHAPDKYTQLFGDIDNSLSA